MSQAILISVRTGSTRLPGKCLKKIKGITTIEHLIRRIKQTKKADKIILCTTTKPSDDILCKIAKKSKIKYFRGSEQDKLKRWYEACSYYNVEKFVNVDGDDIFFDAGLADYVLNMLNNQNADFIDGQGLYNDVYGGTYNALKRVISNKKSNDTEFVKNFFYDEKNNISIIKITEPPEIYKKKNIRLTLDYHEDLELFKRVIEYFYENNIPMDFSEIIKYIDENDLSKINFHREKDWSLNQINKFNL